MKQRVYLCIDLKSFYASVECVERGLDPMTARLVVADPARSEKTICLAVTPAMKALGVHNRCRIFEIPGYISYITAEPRMRLYIQYAAEVYGVYLSYLAKDDIHVYSVDEAFLDVTDYLSMYRMEPETLARTIRNSVLQKTGLPAACGIGTNLYLAKVALDIAAKHARDLTAYLDEETYRASLWEHRPITDFWRIGPGIAKRLARQGIYTMRDVARADVDSLYRIFGVDAELLIDHAWGREPVTIADIKAYRPRTNCLTSGQVLMRDYTFSEGRLIVKEMMDLLCLDMVDRGLVTDSISLYVGYAGSSHVNAAKGSASLGRPTNADNLLVPAAAALYGRIVDGRYPIRRVHISCNHVAPEAYMQYNLLEDAGRLERSRSAQQAAIGIKKRFGKNAILRAMNLESAATTPQRNRQIGGHKSGE